FLVAAAGRTEVADRFIIDGKEPDRRAILGAHVGDGGAVRHRQRGGTIAEIFDEFADHFGPAQRFGHREYKVGCSDALLQAADYVHADHIRRQEVNRLPEHAGFRFDTADAPAHDANSSHHAHVRVGSNEAVGIVDTVPLLHAARKVFEIDLVDDADARRHD